MLLSQLQCINKLLLYFISEEDRQLTGKMLWNLAGMIESGEMLINLGINGLYIEESIMKRELHNNPKEINIAAHNVLSRWRKRFEDPRIAYKVLCDALRSAGLASFIGEALV